jgi:radical SAM-linked protein
MSSETPILTPAVPVILTRYRIQYQRGSELRYVGNLDMQLGWERALRRARLPVAFSQGFNPRPRFHMASALPLGFTSTCEILDLWLNEALEPGEVAQRLQHSAPPGLSIGATAVIPLNLPALQTQVSAARYFAVLREVPAEVILANVLQEVLACPELPRVWRKKPYDLRPLILELELTEASGGEFPGLHMHLTAREGATGRPEEVLAVLGIDPTTARVARTQLVLNEN